MKFKKILSAVAGAVVAAVATSTTAGSVQIPANDSEARAIRNAKISATSEMNQISFSQAMSLRSGAIESGHRSHYSHYSHRSSAR